MKILYGGSVKADNAATLFAADIDGGLIGGAAKAADFVAICRARPPKRPRRSRSGSFLEDHMQIWMNLILPPQLARTR